MVLERFANVMVGVRITVVTAPNIGTSLVCIENDTVFVIEVKA